MFLRESQKLLIFASEKFREKEDFCLVRFFLTFRKLKIGKWSDNCEIIIKDSNLSEDEFVIMWSIKVAECNVHLVGLVIICRRPCENRRSIYSVALFKEPYFKQSMLRSPKTYTCLLGFSQIFSETLAKSSINCENCSVAVRDGCKVPGL